MKQLIRNLLGKLGDPLKGIHRTALINGIRRKGVGIPQYNLTITSERNIQESELADPEFRRNYDETQAILGQVHILTNGTIVPGHRPLLKDYRADIGIDGKGKPGGFHFLFEDIDKTGNVDELRKDGDGYYLVTARQNFNTPHLQDLAQPEYIKLTPKPSQSSTHILSEQASQHNTSHPQPQHHNHQVL